MPRDYGKKPATAPEKCRVEVSRNHVYVWDPRNRATQTFREHDAGRRLLAYDGLAAACRDALAALVKLLPQTEGGCQSAAPPDGWPCLCVVCVLRRALAQTQGEPR